MIRTIKGAIKEFKIADPKTEITEYAIRKMIKDGKIPYARSGKKILINIDNITAYINGEKERESYGN